MQYKTLRKLYYGDEAVYKQTYKTRFESEECIKLDFFIAGKQAFFLECKEVIQMVYQILREDKAISTLLKNLPGAAAEQYSKKCLIDEIVISNRIEGVRSSRKEIGGVLAELESQSFAKGKKSRFNGIVNKYYKLMSDEDIPLDTCENIRTLYDELVLDEVIDENANNAPDGDIFRKDLTEIKSVTEKVIHRGVYPESAIISQMEKALEFLHDNSIEILYRVCIFHYLLEYIHPFYDGNGRLGRFIVSYYLSKELENLLAFRLSEIIKENISAYYNAFETCNDPHNLGDLTPFLIMMLQMILQSIEELKDSLTRKHISLFRYQKLIEEFPNAKAKKMWPLYYVLIQAALFSENGISGGELRDYLTVSRTTVKKLLDNIPQELLLITNENRFKYYKINLETVDSIWLNKADIDPNADL